MSKFRKILAVVLAICLLCNNAIAATNAELDVNDGINFDYDDTATPSNAKYSAKNIAQVECEDVATPSNAKYNDELTQQLITASAEDGASVEIEGMLPEGVQAYIKKIELKFTDLENYVSDNPEAIGNYTGYDIGVLVENEETGDLEEYEPDETVSVKVFGVLNVLKGESDEEAETNGVIKGVHLLNDIELSSETEDAEKDAFDPAKDESLLETATDETKDLTAETQELIIEVNDENDELCFETESFSPYLFYTVDFRYNNLTYSIPGGSEILLSQIFASLAISDDATKCTDVQFTNDELLEIARQDDGDWLLTSLEAFTTNEELTVITEDGRTIRISVTDAQATVTFGNDAFTFHLSDSNLKQGVTVTAYYKPSSTSTTQYKNTTIPLSNRSYNYDYSFSLQNDGSLEFTPTAQVVIMAGKTQTTIPFLSTITDQDSLFGYYLSKHPEITINTIGELIEAYKQFQTPIEIRWTDDKPKIKVYAQENIKSVIFQGEWLSTLHMTEMHAVYNDDTHSYRSYGFFDIDSNNWAPDNNIIVVNQAEETVITANVLELYDAIPVPNIEDYNYTYNTFSEWLENEYSDQPEYLRMPFPITTAELERAYKYYYNGTKPEAIIINGPQYPITPAPTAPYPEYNTSQEVSVYKKIDNLGTDGLYRLYVGCEIEPQPINLLLVIDQSGSMMFDMNGYDKTDPKYNASDTRQKNLIDYLDGTESSVGFIQSFLSANAQNDLAILTFSDDSNLSAKRYIRHWGESKSDVTIEDKLNTPEGATNYTAALWAANKIWQEEREIEAQKEVQALADGTPYYKPQEIMIFLSDGEPTIAYKDGELNTGFANADNVIGTGNAGSHTASFGSALSIALRMAYSDASMILTDPPGTNYDEARKSITTLTPVFDDNGNIYYPGKWVTHNSSFSPMFPKVTNYYDWKINLPGLDGTLMGSFTNASVFYNWYATTIQSKSIDDIAAWFTAQQAADPESNSIPQYDLFELTKKAYAQFYENNLDVITYTIGFANNMDEYYPSNVQRNAVLSYMGGDGKRLFDCKSAASLAKTINDIVINFTDVVMYDGLSQYVTLAPQPNLKVTLESGSKLNPEQTVLYNDETGGITQAGREMLEYDSNTENLFNDNRLVVSFGDHEFSQRIKVQAEFTVQVSAEAEAQYIRQGYQYVDIGDPETDYGTERHSANQYGFYSNNDAALQWRKGEMHTAEFPKPVVKLAHPPKRTFEIGEVIPKKSPTVIGDPEISKTIDYLGDNDGIKDAKNPDTTLDDGTVSGLGDLYRLYLNAKDITDPVNLLLVIDRSNSMYDDEDMEDSAGNPINRMRAITEFLTGSTTDHTDGFIPEFLAINEENRIAAVTFGNDSGAKNATGKRVNWRDPLNPIDEDFTFDDYLINWTQTYNKEIAIEQCEEYGSTNYTAAYQVAYEMLQALQTENPPTNSKTYVVFLSDGVPTYAYTDGKMQNGLDPANAEVFGSGNDCYFEDFVWEIAQLLTDVYYDGESYIYPSRDYRLSHDGGEESSVPKPVIYQRNYEEWFNYYEGEYSNVTLYPVGSLVDYDDLDFSVLGLKYDSETDAITVADETLFNEVFANSFDYYGEDEYPTEEQYYYMLGLAMDFYNLSDSNHYDVMQLTESAYDDFKDHIDMIDNTISIISIGFSGDLSGIYIDELGREREAAEVLKYMAQNSGPNGGYIYAPSSKQLAQDVNKLFLVTNPTISDELSEDVDVYQAQTDLSVYRKEDPNDINETPQYLYRNGEFTELGNTILDNVELTPARRDNNGLITQKGQLIVDFKTDFALGDAYTYTASFNIAVEENTKENFENVYPHTGNKNTDYGTNRTSSNQPGFYSNTNAVLYWGPDPTQIGETQAYSKAYQKPVVQVAKQTTPFIVFRKTDENGNAIAGARFALYGSKQDESIAENPMTGYENLQSDANGIFSPNDLILSNGTYYLQETQAPKGCTQMEQPLKFTVENAQIIVYGDGINSTVQYLTADVETGVCTITVKNKSKSVLPKTGGNGTVLFYSFGTILILLSVLFLYKRRKFQ